MAHDVLFAAAMKILLLESDSSTRSILSLILNELGHEVSIPEGADADPDEAIRFLNGFWPDAVLMNYFLSGTTAPQLCDEIQELFGEMPTTVIHSPAPEHRFFALRRPETWFLRSPFSPEDLQGTLELIESSEISLTG